MNMESLPQIFLQNVGIRLRGVCAVFLVWFLSLLSNQMLSNDKQGAARFM